MRTRLAQVDDLTEIVRLIRTFHAKAFATFGLDFNVGYAALLAKKMTKAKSMLVLESPDRKLHGGIGGMVNPWGLDGRIRIFQEVFFYLEPGYRQHSHLLMHALERQCQNDGVQVIIMAHMDDGNLEKMDRYYLSKGYKMLEHHYIKRVDR